MTPSHITLNHILAQFREWPLKGQVRDVATDLAGNHFIKMDLN